MCLSSRVSPTNSETPSDLIYLANPCVDLCGARDRVATSWVCHLEFSEFPSSDRGSSWPRVEDLSRVCGLHSCKTNPYFLNCIYSILLGRLIAWKSLRETCDSSIQVIAAALCLAE